MPSVYVPCIRKRGALEATIITLFILPFMTLCLYECMCMWVCWYVGMHLWLYACTYLHYFEHVCGFVCSHMRICMRVCISVRCSYMVLSSFLELVLSARNASNWKMPKSLSKMRWMERWRSIGKKVWRRDWGKYGENLEERVSAEDGVECHRWKCQRYRTDKRLLHVISGNGAIWLDRRPVKSFILH